MKLLENKKQIYLEIKNIKLKHSHSSFIIETAKGYILIKVFGQFYINEGYAKKIIVIFANKYNFFTFLLHLRLKLNELNKIYFLKFRLKGLGYRFRKISNSLFRFYFTRTNYIYFHKPKNIIVKSRKKKVIILSNNKSHLHLVFSHLMLLHTTGPYNRRGFMYPRKIIYLKPGKKVF